MARMILLVVVVQCTLFHLRRIEYCLFFASLFSEYFLNIATLMHAPYYEMCCIHVPAMKLLVGFPFVSTDFCCSTVSISILISNSY
jgi:hypothetical protein